MVPLHRGIEEQAMTNTSYFTLSRHAARRCASRGIRPAFLSELIYHADLEADVGGSAVALSVSRARSRALNLDDRLGRYAAVISDDATVITIVPLRSNRRGRVYRNGRG